MRTLPRLLALAPLLLATSLGLAACGSDDDPAPASGAEADDADVKGAKNCTATLHFLQKDAYKSTAGRTSAQWPPHTTTVLDIACGDPATVASSSVQANHGTKPTDVDATGAVILVETNKATVTGKRAELDALKAAFDACSCEGGTEFLSLDQVQDEAVQKVVAELVSYAGEVLVCTGDKPTADVVGLLEKGDLAGFLDALSGCTFREGESFEKGFDEALGKLLAASSTTLAAYHVCNNDAALQEQLFKSFQATGKVTACVNTDVLCRGPRWFYTPLRSREAWLTVALVPGRRME